MRRRGCCVGYCRLIVSTAPVGEAPSLPQRRSRLGSPVGGAGSPNGLTEGVYCVGCCRLIVSTAPCRGRQLGDPKPTQLRSTLNGNDQRLQSSWLPPGGSQGVLTFSVYALLQRACAAQPGCQYLSHGFLRLPSPGGLENYRIDTGFVASLSGGTAAAPPKKRRKIRRFWEVITWQLRPSAAGWEPG